VCEDGDMAQTPDETDRKSEAQNNVTPAIAKMESLLKANEGFEARHKEWVRTTEAAAKITEGLEKPEVGPEPTRVGEEMDAREMIDKGTAIAMRVREAYDREANEKAGIKVKKGEKVTDVTKDVMEIQDEVVQAYCAQEALDAMGKWRLDISGGDLVELMKNVPVAIDLAGDIRKKVIGELADKTIGLDPSLARMTEIFLKNARTAEERKPFEMAKAELAGYNDFEVESISVDMSTAKLKARLNKIGVEIDERVIAEKIAEVKLSDKEESSINLTILLAEMSRTMNVDDRDKTQAYMIGMIEAGMKTLDFSENLSKSNRTVLAVAKALTRVVDDSKGKSYALFVLAGLDDTGQTSEVVFARIKKINSEIAGGTSYNEFVNTDHRRWLNAKQVKKDEAEKVALQTANALKLEARNAENARLLAAEMAVETNPSVKELMSNLMRMNPDGWGERIDSSLENIRQSLAGEDQNLFFDTLAKQLKELAVNENIKKDTTTIVDRGSKGLWGLRLLGGRRIQVRESYQIDAEAVKAGLRRLELPEDQLGLEDRIRLRAQQRAVDLIAQRVNNQGRLVTRDYPK